LGQVPPERIQGAYPIYETAGGKIKVGKMILNPKYTSK